MINLKNQKHITADETVITSTLVSFFDVLINFSIAIVSGSVVMIAQGLQGLADLVTTSLLFVGVRRSRRKATASHPFGYGRELFFWVLIAGVFAFIVSGAVAISRAVEQIRFPQPLDSISLAMVVLVIGAITNGYSARKSIKRLSGGISSKGLVQYIRSSSLVESKMTLLVDFMGTTSAILGLTALGLYELTGQVIFDGLGALVIGSLTAAGSLFLIADLHGLIIGRSPHQNIIEQIRKSALSIKGVKDVLDLRAVSVGSGSILAILEVHFKDDLNTDEIESITDEIKAKITKNIPTVSQVQVEAETPDGELRPKFTKPGR